MFDQEKTPIGTCVRCGGELYAEEEKNLCIMCRKEVSKWDSLTVEAVMEAVDKELEKYLSDDLRNSVWNAMCGQFLPNA